MPPTELHDTLFFYVEGSDLHEVAPLLRERFKSFLEARDWVSNAVWFVEQVDEADSTLRPGDFPDWDLGLNLKLATSIEDRRANWFEDVAAIVVFLGELTKETRRSFVVGAAFANSPVADDLLYTSVRPIDLDELRSRLRG
jgi:hypothetical protein